MSYYFSSKTPKLSNIGLTAYLNDSVPEFYLETLRTIRAHQTFTYFFCNRFCCLSRGQTGGIQSPPSPPTLQNSLCFIHYFHFLLYSEVRALLLKFHVHASRPWNKRTWVPWRSRGVYLLSSSARPWCKQQMKTPCSGRSSARLIFTRYV